jgi:hypothetical protein
MGSPFADSASFDRADTVSKRLNHRTWWRITALFTLAATVVAAGFSGLQVMTLRAGDNSQVGSNARERPAAEPASAAVTSPRKLSVLHAEIARLADSVLANVEEHDRLVSAAALCNVALAELQLACGQAKLARERAEIAVIEYEQGTARQDEAKSSGDVFEARRNLESVKQKIEVLNLERSQIKETTKDPIAGLAASILIRDRLRVAERQESVAATALAEAEARRDELLDRTKPARVKDLRATAERLKSNEQALKAKRDIEMSKLTELQRAARERAPVVAEKRVLALLDRAMAIEEQIRANLDARNRVDATDPACQQEIVGLTYQLEVIVDQAAIEGAPAEHARLKARIKAAANRYPAAIEKGP